MSHLDASFGVEIECYLPDGESMASAAAAVTHRLGALGSCKVESYNHGSRTWWKVVTDGSLNDYSRGVEFVSPILKGDDGLKQVDAVCRALTDFGCTVSKRCGFHVHVGVGYGPSVDFYKNLVKLYALYEPVIDSLMPMSRRGNTNQFCRSHVAANLSALASATSLEQVTVAATNLRSNGGRRFFKLNLDAYARHKTVEFRQHSGTVDSPKALRWTVLCLRMVHAAKGSLSLGSAPAANKARPGSKAHKIGEMLLRPEGVTGVEICTAMGWPSVSVPAQAKAAGLEITSQRTGRVVRYWAVNVHATSASTPVTVDGLAQILGVSDEERSYLHQRAADLSGPVSWAA